MFKKLNEDFTKEVKEKNTKEIKHNKYIPIADEEMMQNDGYEAYMNDKEDI